jgi:hypothetical protein
MGKKSMMRWRKRRNEAKVRLCMCIESCSNAGGFSTSGSERRTVVVDGKTRKVAPTTQIIFVGNKLLGRGWEGVLEPGQGIDPVYG